MPEERSETDAILAELYEMVGKLESRGYPGDSDKERFFYGEVKREDDPNGLAHWDSLNGFPGRTAPQDQLAVSKREKYIRRIACYIMGIKALDKRAREKWVPPNEQVKKQEALCPDQIIYYRQMMNDFNSGSVWRGLTGGNEP